MIRPILLFAFLLTIAACSGSQETTTATDSDASLDIQQPESGSLSGDQLAAIAADIRRLEVHPLADGADAGRRNLLGGPRALPTWALACAAA